jgi:CRP-like cAMP-binding protein
VDGYLTLNAIVSETFKMPPAKLPLYLTIMITAVQRLMRGNEVPDDLRDSTPLPDAYVGSVSRRALAAATGLSRETVCRMVLEMPDEGLLSQGPRGELAAKAGILAQSPLVW